MQPLKIKESSIAEVVIRKWDDTPYMKVALEATETRIPLYVIAEDAIAYVDWGNNDVEI